MSLVGNLIGFGLRQAIGTIAGDVAGGVAGQVAGPVIQLVERHFTDHGQTLSKALARANDRAWQSLSIALAGDGFLDQIKVFFSSGDDKGIREQVRLFLQEKNIGFEGTPDFRKKCLIELNNAKKAGLLTAQTLSPNAIARQTASFQRYADPIGMVEGAEQVVSQIAAELEADYPNLAKLLRKHPSGGPPLLVSAYAFFFRREVETNQELAHGLLFDGLRQLSADQEKAFEEVGKALSSLGDQFDQVFQQLARIEVVVVETQVVAEATHGAVLDLQGEMQRLASLHLANADDARRLMQEVLERVIQAGMQKGEVNPQHSFIIRSEDERNAVKQLLARFRQMPSEQQTQLPALLNGLGKLQVGSGDFDGARRTFVAVAEHVDDATAQAEAQFNAYRAALEEKKWDAALAAIEKAATLDAQRFAPFPVQRYQPKRILGAGGFGTAFLCHDHNFDEEVVVKTLHDAAMERNMAEVFREARLLRKLNHPAIIGVHECEFAEPAKHARPYIVMDYFAGGSLEGFIQQRGTIPAEGFVMVACQIAQGMQAAHQQGILHRDLKPDNVLVRKEGDSWTVKVIDFGLALRQQTIETSMAARSAGNTILGDSVAGTLKYAPPEQMGEMKGVKPGPYSDVYSFGKLCCYALFKTTEPKRRQWSEIPEGMAELLERCMEQDLQHRLPSFEPVLKVLETFDPQRQNAAARQKAELERKPGEIITNSVGMKFAWIPPGVFVMGSPTSEEGRDDDEAQHEVSLSKGYYLAVGPVSRGQFARFVKDSGYKTQAETEGGAYGWTGKEWQLNSALNWRTPGFEQTNEHPVVCVSWNDAVAFCRWLGEREKQTYRLPTQGEWEYACRAGTTTAYHFGTSISVDLANYQNNIGMTTPIGNFRANAWGLHDMHGNVWEWCADWFGDYPTGTVVDPQGPATGQRRVLRGGSFFYRASSVRSAYRYANVPTLRNSDNGFRPSRTFTP